MLKEIMSDNELNLGDEIEAWTNTPDDKEPYEQEGNPRLYLVFNTNCSQLV